ncbi:hypothetical protein C8Q70DRAFT_12773 [Cubamyces menziesii]|uniref:Uncharacterized protein n=1 Tax=Trametes cubensis TaxID=1111947 RepID=A0AAD7U1S0_9APHY|nr:hypothetical protein C8Q70DRAFT_12773 [Cubamyces menziesii]KAJ8496175.1 hypothetical protein ONZ51_g1288 [Trametes cubensis]
MGARSNHLLKLWYLLSQACGVVAQADDARSLATALQNINGMSSVLSLIPVLSGKTQNVKAIAARTFPCSLAVAGLGAGRVLSKLQIGLMLLSADLYRNLVGELSYYHNEYVNAFSPSLIHVPSGTPERHSSNTIVNHNLTEDYMVEAWFRTQGSPARVELSQKSNRRAFCGVLVYLAFYVFETFLSVQNAATGAAIPLVVMQATSGICWIVAICALQAIRGQGTRYVYLNRLGSTEYRCYQLVTSGKHVQSVVLSTHLSNIREYNLFDSKYECGKLHAIGGAIVMSGIIDLFATVLIVGLNEWAYGWLGLQVALIAVKVFFSLEPIRRMPILEVQAVTTGVSRTSSAAAKPRNRTPLRDLASTRLPMSVASQPPYSFEAVYATSNLVYDSATSSYWRSRSPGVFIGQPYYLEAGPGRLDEKHPGGLGASLPPDMRPREAHEKQVSQQAPVSSIPAIPVQHPSPITSEGANKGSASIVSLTQPSLQPLVTQPPVDPSVVHNPIVISPEPAIHDVTAIPVAEIHNPQSQTPNDPCSTSDPASSAGSLPPTAALSGIPSQTSLSLPPPPLPKSPRVLANGKLFPSASSPITEPMRYLALSPEGCLTLSEKQPAYEVNQALQREFLACLVEVVRSNKVPSPDFLHTVEAMREGIRATMNDHWYAFGTTDLVRYLRTAHRDVLWNQLL